MQESLDHRDLPFDFRVRLASVRVCARREGGMRPLAMTLHRTQSQLREGHIIAHKNMALGLREFPQVRERFRYCEPWLLLIAALIFQRARSEAEEAALYSGCREEPLERFDEAPGRQMHDVVGENRRNNHVDV